MPTGQGTAQGEGDRKHFHPTNKNIAMSNPFFDSSDRHSDQGAPYRKKKSASSVGVSSQASSSPTDSGNGNPFRRSSDDSFHSTDVTSVANDSQQTPLIPHEGSIDNSNRSNRSGSTSNTGIRSQKSNRRGSTSSIPSNVIEDFNEGIGTSNDQNNYRRKSSCSVPSKNNMDPNTFKPQQLKPGKRKSVNRRGSQGSVGSSALYEEENKDSFNESAISLSEALNSREEFNAQVGGHEANDVYESSSDGTGSDRGGRQNRMGSVTSTGSGGTMQTNWTRASVETQRMDNTSRKYSNLRKEKDRNEFEAVHSGSGLISGGHGDGDEGAGPVGRVATNSSQGQSKLSTVAIVQRNNNTHVKSKESVGVKKTNKSALSLSNNAGFESSRSFAYDLDEDDLGTFRSFNNDVNKNDKSDYTRSNRRNSVESKGSDNNGGVMLRQKSVMIMRPNSRENDSRGIVEEDYGLNDERERGPNLAEEGKISRKESLVKKASSVWDFAVPSRNVRQGTDDHHDESVSNRASAGGSGGKRRMSKKTRIILLAVLVVILGGVAACLYFLIFNKKTNRGTQKALNLEMDKNGVNDDLGDDFVHSSNATNIMPANNFTENEGSIDEGEGFFDSDSMNATADDLVSSPTSTPLNSTASDNTPLLGNTTPADEITNTSSSVFPSSISPTTIPSQSSNSSYSVSNSSDIDSLGGNSTFDATNSTESGNATNSTVFPTTIPLIDVTTVTPTVPVDSNSTLFVDNGTIPIDEDNTTSTMNDTVDIDDPFGENSTLSVTGTNDTLIPTGNQTGNGTVEFDFEGNSTSDIDLDSNSTSDFYFESNSTSDIDESIIFDGNGTTNETDGNIDLEGNETRNEPDGLEIDTNSTSSEAGLESNTSLTNETNPFGNNTNISDVDMLSSPYEFSFSMEGLFRSSRFGSSVSLSKDGSFMAIGATQSLNSEFEATGAVYLFSMVNGTPSLNQMINGTAPNGEFGNAIALSSDGSRIVIGSRSESEQSGAVRVYERNISSISWEQVGDVISNQNELARSGWSVAISGDGNVIAVGAPTTEGGTVSCFQLETSEEGVGPSWTPLGSVIEGSPGETVGYSIALSNDGFILAVGAPKAANLLGSPNAGKAVVYSYDDDWTPHAPELYGEAAEDIDGTAVAISQDGSVLVTGAKGQDGNGGSWSNSGYCRVYEFVEGIGYELIYTIPGENPEERMGSFVAISPDGSAVACGGTEGNRDGLTVSGVVRVWSRITLQESTIWPRGVSDSLFEGAIFGSAIAFSAGGDQVIVGAPEYSFGSAGSTAGIVQYFEVYPMSRY